MVKNMPANAGDTRDSVQSLGQEDPLKQEVATTFQYSYHEIMDRGARWATVHGPQRVGHD